MSVPQRWIVDIRGNNIDGAREYTVIAWSWRNAEKKALSLAGRDGISGARPVGATLLNAKEVFAESKANRRKRCESAALRPGQAVWSVTLQCDECCEHESFKAPTDKQLSRLIHQEGWLKNRRLLWTCRDCNGHRDWFDSDGDGGSDKPPAPKVPECIT